LGNKKTNGCERNMEYDVISISLTREGNYRIAKNCFVVSAERINTETNMIFKDCKTCKEIEDSYNAFWNINDFWVRGQCEVLKVIPIELKEAVDEKTTNTLLPVSIPKPDD